MKEYFNYIDGKIYWKVRLSNRHKIGDEAASKHNKGYLATRIHGKAYLVHHVVWIMHNGPIPDGLEIDHFNGIRTDNRIENLRVMTRKENSQNTRHSKGVYWAHWTKRWRVCPQINGKQKHIGYFDNYDEARQAYLTEKNLT